jgi:hypothetical protein
MKTIEIQFRRHKLTKGNLPEGQRAETESAEVRRWGSLAWVNLAMTGRCS